MNFSNLWLNWIFRSFDPEQDDEGSRGPSNSSGPSSSNNGGNNIQTFSVTIETTGNSPIKPKKFFQQKSASETEIQEPLFNVIHPLSDVKNNDNCLALNRSRRQIKKKKTHYCDHCRMDYDTGWFKVSLLGVDSLLRWLHVYSGRFGVIVVDLCYFALFEDFSL